MLRRLNPFLIGSTTSKSPLPAIQLIENPERLEISATIVGVIILAGFLVGLQGLTPASVQGAITGRIVEIAPQVSGRVVTVEASSE